MKKTDVLYRAFRALYLSENKAFGLEVQENRFGSLLLRLRSCAERLNDYLDGTVEKIDELEEKQVAFGKKEPIRFNKYANIFTACEA